MKSQSTFSECEINRRHYWLNQSDGVAKRPIAPGTRVGREVQVTTPHPDLEKRRAGWRVAWIFLAGCFLCAAVPIVAALG